MSWYIRKLLLDRENIRANLEETRYDGSVLEDLGSESYLLPYIVMNFDSDTYLDLLTVEAKLKELIDKKSVTKGEIKATKLILSGKTMRSFTIDNQISYKTVVKQFKSLCNKLAFCLGGYFTNDGYISYIAEKYKLNEEETKKLKNYIYERNNNE